MYFGLCRFVVRPPWEVSNTIYQKTSQSCYSKLSLPFMLLISMLAGFFFAWLAFVQIWILGPVKKILYLNGVMLRKFSNECYGECNMSLLQILRSVEM